MSEAVAALSARPDLNRRPRAAGSIIFIALLLVGLGYTLGGLIGDIQAAHTPPVAVGAFVLLGIALLIALGFEFVNGFHDTANAVATVIYTHSLPPHVAVIWSGAFNFFGVMVSSGAVAFSVLSLLPVELILQVGGGAGFAMIFALLIAAIVWNLGTWWLGLPASSSHTMIGSIIGVGLANQLMSPAGSGTSGVDWAQAMGVFRALLFSPVVGFIASALLLLAMKAVIHNRTLYTAPTSDRAPPLWIRGLLILTCTGVSFAHGSNDGQKGMGLIMLILIGSVPTAFALNHAMPGSATPAFYQATARAQSVFAAHAAGASVASAEAARGAVTAAVQARQISNSETWAALGTLADDIARQVRAHGEMSQIPAAAVPNVRNDMYLVSEGIRLALKSPGLSAQDASALTAYRGAVGFGDQVHPGLGQGRRGDRAWPWHDDRLEAHRGDGRGKDRQKSPDLWPGRVRRVDRSGNNRRRRYVRPSGLHNPCAVERGGRNHGRQWVRAAVEHSTQHRHGLGADPACGDAVVRDTLLAAAAGDLTARQRLTQ